METLRDAIATYLGRPEPRSHAETVEMFRAADARYPGGLVEFLRERAPTITAQDSHALRSL